jgi:diguanylate cyclase (GGDEF)-like protein/PAS domain S-box-containing protein
MPVRPNELSFSDQARELIKPAYGHTDLPRMIGSLLDRRRVTAGALTGWCLATAAVFALRLATPSWTEVISGVSLLLAAVGAGLGCLLRARHVPQQRSRQAWVLMGCAATSWGLGQVVTTVYELVLDQEIPFPSLADLGYLLAVPLFGAGLLRLAVPTGNLTVRLRAVLDGLLISAALLLVSWVSVLGPVARSSADGVIDKAILLAYPAGDVAMVTLVAYVVLRVRATGLRPGVPLSLIGVALACLAVADSGYAYLSLTDGYASGSVIDSGWLLGFTAIMLAALLPTRGGDSDATPETRPLGMLLPYLVIVVAMLAAVGSRPGHALDWFASIVTCVLVLLMVIRQVLTMQENSRLTRYLEDRVIERTSELRMSQARFRALVEHSSDVVTLVSTEGVVRYQSDSGALVLGHHSETLIGLRFADLLDEPSAELLTTTLADVAQKAPRVTVVELRLRHGDGAWRQIETTVTNLLDEAAVQALVLNSRDVSERRRLEGQLLHQAFHDSLTGLANRALFNDRVAHALQRRRRDDEQVAVLFLDLDGFKEVNDSLGHTSGDELLVQVAARLESCSRQGDTIARLGGDEFAVLVEAASGSAEPTELAARIQRALHNAFTIAGRELFVQASIGIATTGPGEPVTDAGQLVRNADLAMYRAKAKREGEFAHYDPSMHSSLVDRLELEADLRRAVRAGDLHVFYQPTYTIGVGDVVGVEALLRWTHPERGEVPPTVFIPIAEQTGLIHEMGRFVLQTATHQAAEWLATAPACPLTVGVNISARQLQRDGFVEEVRDVLASSGLPPQMLVLEMTESILMDDTDGTLHTLKQLKDMGLRLAIDDFGTGYSSLSYLHRFPVDILKIDRSFVEQLSGADPQESLVQSIVQLGQTLQLETIAEGIEDHTQLLALRRLGCQLAQGYHFGRPAPASVITQLIRDVQADSEGTARLYGGGDGGSTVTATLTPSP